MCICPVCGNEVKQNEEFEWHGLDGDKIHKKCKAKLEDHYNKINNMSDEEFKTWIMGGDI